MSIVQSLRGAAVFALGAVVLPASTALAATRASIDEPRPVRVSVSDVEASNKKIALAYGALMDMWSKAFEGIGERFAAPRIVRYDRSGYTACGRISTNNAMYCPTNNTLYYDQVFVAGMQKIIGNATGTDGDMAGVGIIAHEVGHAVAMQLGHASRNSYQNESVADCLAGAFANQAGKDGSLEPGDVEEAEHAMAMVGDPTPEPTGNARYDRLVQRQLARNSHGTKEQRMQNFRTGLDGGAAACLSEFR
jgi:predicted metalloprotease